MKNSVNPNIVIKQQGKPPNEKRYLQPNDSYAEYTNTQIWAQDTNRHLPKEETRMVNKYEKMLNLIINQRDTN